MANDIAVFQGKRTNFFIEAVSLRKCLSIKTILEDSSCNSIGTVGISFFLDEIILSDALQIINQLGLASERTLIHSKIFLHETINNNLAPLSKREKECAHYLIKGMSTKEMAMVLKVSPRTIESHIDHIKTKLNCNTRLQIISKSLEHLI